MFEKVFVNELDKKLDKSEIGIVLVWNSLDYFAPAMKKVICEISDDLIYSWSNLLYALDKSIELQGKLPPSASKDTLGKPIVHMRAAKEFLHRTLVTTGATNVALGMGCCDLGSYSISCESYASSPHPTFYQSCKKKRKNANGDPEAAGTGNGDDAEVEESNEYDDPDACYTGRNPGQCCCGAEFNMPDELDNRVKIVYTECHNWSCTGKLISEGKEVPCEQSFTRGDTLWTHYHKVHLKIYRYMCSLKKKDKVTDCDRKVEERAGCLKHKEVDHGIGKSPFRCKYCDKPISQINKIAPHEAICSVSDTSKTEKLLDCDYCTKSFRSKQYLNNHVSTEHAEEAGVREKWHHCNTCGRDYANSSSLRQHKCRLQGEKRKRQPKNSQVSE